MSMNAVIVGVGQGLSASLARQIAARGGRIVLAARTGAKLADLAKETGAKVEACDASRPSDVDALFKDVEGRFGVPDLVVFNASYRVRGPEEVPIVLQLIADLREAAPAPGTPGTPSER